MQKITFLLIALGVLGAIVLFLAPDKIVFAQGATRTWVSGVGDDVNPCSRTAPCKTFAGAISKTAAGGEIDALDPGGFGAVTITKAITIDGGPNAGGILSSGTNGIIVNAGPSDVVIIQNLNIDGVGAGLNGIRFLAGGSLIVQNVKIFGHTQIGIDFEPGSASKLIVSDSTAENNAGGGILVKPGVTGSALVSLLRVQTNKNLYGVRVEDRSNVTIDNSIASGNTNQGFICVSVSAATNVFIENSVATNNGAGANSAGVRSDGAATTVRISNDVITNNTNNGLLATSGAQIISFGNNKNAGNNPTNGAPTSTIGLQ